MSSSPKTSEDPHEFIVKLQQYLLDEIREYLIGGSEEGGATADAWDAEADAEQLDADLSAAAVADILVAEHGADVCGAADDADTVLLFEDAELLHEPTEPDLYPLDLLLWLLLAADDADRPMLIIDLVRLGLYETG